MFSILGKQKNQKDVNDLQNQTEIASICTYLPLYCLHRTFAVQIIEVVVWDWLKWWVENGTKVTGAKNRAQKWNARHKKAYRNPQRFRPKTFCAWTFKSEKSNQNLSQKMNSQITYGFFTFYYSSSRKNYGIDFPKNLFTTRLRKRLM